MLSEKGLDVLFLMKRMGGSFASALADAWLRADVTNEAKLRATFPELWDEYEKMADLKRAAKR